MLNSDGFCEKNNLEGRESIELKKVSILLEIYRYKVLESVPKLS